MEQRTGTGHGAFTSPFESLTKFNDTFETALNRSRAAFETGLKALQEESVQFMNRRMEHTSRTVEEAQRCRNALDLLAAQQKWAAEFARDYFEESARFGEVMQKWMREASGFAGDAAEDAKRDLKRAAE